ncbi:MAG: hypothetical protein ABIA83_02100 [Patescibacteria group bacterium]
MSDEHDQTTNAQLLSAIKEAGRATEEDNWYTKMLIISAMIIFAGLSVWNVRNGMKHTNMLIAQLMTDVENLHDQIGQLQENCTEQNQSSELTWPVEQSTVDQPVHEPAGQFVTYGGGSGPKL